MLLQSTSEVQWSTENSESQFRVSFENDFEYFGQLIFTTPKFPTPNLVFSKKLRISDSKFSVPHCTINFESLFFKPQRPLIEIQRNKICLHPTSMTMTEKTFSEFVFGETLPKPTDVKLLKVKYMAVMYLSLTDGPEVILFVTGSNTTLFCFLWVPFEF